MLLVCHSSGINTMDMCIAHTVFLVVERGDPSPAPTPLPFYAKLATNYRYVYE